MRRGINQHALEKICRLEAVRAIKRGMSEGVRELRQEKRKQIEPIQI